MSGKPVWMNPAKQAPDADLLAFCAGRDVEPVPAADHVLVPYDIWTNRAHVIMLAEREIVPKDGARALLDALAKLEQLHDEGRWSLNPQLEDVHTNIETWVSSEVGAELGGMIHTARSRNDQVATDMRLWMRDVLLDFAGDLCAAIEVCAQRAIEGRKMVMPGLTHHQPGGVSSLGHWHLCHAFAMLRDVERVRHALALLDACPLGAVASYGTSWNIDRTRTAQLLGFSRMQHNALDAVASRWEMEAEAAHAVTTALVHASMLAQDLIVYGTEPFGLVTLDERHTTGSSVMPQKRNPDPCEVIKAKAALVASLQHSLRATATGNVTGYNRDTQWTKYTIMDIVREARAVPGVIAKLVRGARWHEERMRAACERGFLTALDIAEHLASHGGLPFRAAYRVVSTAVTTSRAAEQSALSAEAVNAALESENFSLRLTRDEVDAMCRPERAIAAKRSAGSPAPPQVTEGRRRVETERKKATRWVSRTRDQIQEHRQACMRLEGR